MYWGWPTGSDRPGTAAPENKIIKYFIQLKPGFCKPLADKTKIIRRPGFCVWNKDGAFRKQEQVFPQIVLCKQMQDDDDAQMQGGMMT